MLTDLLNQAVICETKNDWVQAAHYYVKALEISPANKDILLNLGSCLFNQGDYEKALELYLRCYRHPLQTTEGKEQILQFVLGAFYQPNAAHHQANYENNVNALKSYEHNYIHDFPMFADLPYLCIPASDDKFYIMEKKTGNLSDAIIISPPSIQLDLSPGVCVAAINIFSANILEQVLRQTEDPTWENGIKVPLYLIWKENALKYAFLQMNDYSQLVSKGRLVFFDQDSVETHVSEFFKDTQAILPNKIFGEEIERTWLTKIINDAHNYRNVTNERLLAELVEKYGNYKREYYQQLFMGSPRQIRILFCASRFTQVVKYSARDFAKACTQVGMQCEVLIDKSDIHRMNTGSLTEKIHEFCPDIVFLINYFKSDYGVVLRNLMCITWMQDPVYQISSKEHAEKFNENDYILSCTKIWVDLMVKTGFPKERIGFLSFPADSEIFYPRTLTAEETAKYESDITVCSNLNNDPEKFLAQLKSAYAPNTLPEIQRNRIIAFFDLFHQWATELIDNGGLIYNEEHCEQILKQCAHRLELNLDDQFMAYLSKYIFTEYGYSLPRILCVKALTTAKVNFKIWGKNWDLFDRSLNPYAMGWIQHGPELAKVYSGSKMVVGTFALYTGHFRLWEAMFCGALNLVRYIPPEYDLWDIREYLNEGEGFVFYHDQNDLISKVNYYACHEAERKNMVKQGQQKAQRLFTYNAAVNQCFEFIRKDLLRVTNQ